MKLLLAAHRWLGWLLAPLLALASVTGAVLLWLQPWPVSDASADPRPRPQAGVLARAVDQGLAAALQRRPDLRMSYIDLPRTTADPVRLRLVPVSGNGPEAWADVDTTSGVLLDLRTDNELFAAWLFNLHHQLLLGDDGSWVLGGVALLALITLLIALPVWLRMRRWRAPRLARRWHRRVGIVLWLPLLVVTATGLALSWPDVVRQPLVALTGQPRFAPPKAKPPVAAEGQAPRAPISAGAALQAGAQQWPTALPTRLYAAKAGTWRLRLRTDEWHPNGLNSVYLNAWDGKVVQTVQWRELPLSTRYANVVYPLHIAAWGDGAGPAGAVLVRCCWTLVAIGLAWLVLSGVRWRRPARQPAASARPAGPGSAAPGG